LGCAEHRNTAENIDKYRNTAKKIGKYRNTASKVDEIKAKHHCKHSKDFRLVKMGISENDPTTFKGF